MQDFDLAGPNKVPILIKPGFPKGCKQYELPNCLKYHASYQKCIMLFQIVNAGPYEIAISDYLPDTDDRITCHASNNCIEMHFVLTGKASFRLENLDWITIDRGHHNLIALSSVKNETYFKILPISTFDIHFTKDQLQRLAIDYPQLKALLEALNAGKYASFSKLPIKTTPLMFHLILQIKERILAGEAETEKTTRLIEQLIILVIENKPINTKYNFEYLEIEKVYRAHRYIPEHLAEGAIIMDIIKEAKMKPVKFREGFDLLYGCLPKEYLRLCRLEKAMMLAVEGRSNTIIDIAQVCGYKSPTQLSKSFFKHHGEKIMDIIKKNPRK